MSSSHRPEAQGLVFLGHAYLVASCVGALLLCAHLWLPSMPEASFGNGLGLAVASVSARTAVKLKHLVQPNASEARYSEAVQLNATYELLSVSVEGRTAEVEAVWQLLPSPRAVLLLAHGCSHSGTDFWPPSPACPNCLGLPEEKRIASAALEAGYLPLAFSSADREGSRCWRPEADGPRVALALEQLLARFKLQSLPRLALGASSGGGFVALLPLYSPGFAALCIQIMAAHAGQLIHPNHTYPPSLWVHMPRDEAMARGVEGAISALSTAGFVARQIRVAPQAMDSGTLLRRVGPPYNSTSSAAAFDALSSAKLLDAGGMLLSDPRSSDWREALAAAAQGNGVLAAALEEDSLEPDRSALAETLNVLWARHEIVADAMPEVLAFFAESLAREHREQEQNATTAVLN